MPELAWLALEIGKFFTEERGREISVFSNEYDNFFSEIAIMSNLNDTVTK